MQNKLKQNTPAHIELKQEMELYVYDLVLVFT